MKDYKRYHLITYCDDCGLDEKEAYHYILDAHKASKNYLKSGYEQIFIYDQNRNSIAYLYNGYYVPDHYFSKDVDIKSTVIFTPETISKHRSTRN